jgi:hypothetical protein
MRTPAGWFAVAYSSELGRRGVTQLSYFGEPLLLFRAADGEPVILGAHHWYFDGIERTSKVRGTAVRAWPVIERNGIVFAHYHPTNESPRFEIPRLPEFGSPDWTPPATRRWTLATDVQQMMESTLVAAQRQHGDGAAFEPAYKVDGADFRLRLRAEMQTPVGRVPGTLDIRSHGFGYTVVRFSGAVETLLITTATPVDDEHVDARYTFTIRRLADDETTRLIEQRFVEELQRQVHSDARGAMAATRPVTDPNAGPTRAWRGWAEQFYV